MSIINKRISSARKDRSMTQQELADKLNVSRSTISNWEVGRNYPDLDMIVQLSDIFNLSLDILLREDTEMVQEVSSEQRKGKGRKWWIAGLSSALIISLVAIGFILKESTNFFRYFSPVYMEMINKDKADLSWQTVEFAEKKLIDTYKEGRNEVVYHDYFTFDSIFYDKEITNTNSSTTADTLSVKISEYDTGKIVDEFKLKPDKTKSLKQLKKNIKYKLELIGRDEQLLISIN